MESVKGKLLPLYIVAVIMPLAIGILTYRSPALLWFQPWGWLYLLPMVGILGTAAMVGEFKVTRPAPGTVLAVALILGVSAISALTTAVNPDGAWVYMVRNISLLLLAWLIHSLGHGRVLLSSVLLGLTFWIGLSYFVIAFEADNPAYDWRSFFVGVMNVRHIGYLLVLYVGIAAGLAFTSERRWPFLLVLLLGLTFVNLSGGRAAIVASFIAGGVAAMCTPHWKENLAIFGGIFVASIPLSLVYIPPQVDWGIERLIFTVPGYTSDIDIGESRMLLWDRALSLIRSHPVVGYGDGQFYHFVADDLWEALHPHNIYLQALFSFGVLGASAIAYLIGKAVLANRFAPALAPVIGTLALGLLDGPLYFTSSGTIFVICCALNRRGEEKYVANTPAAAD